MMIKKVTVEEFYALPGFQEISQEYKKLAIKKLPMPLHRKEDYLALEAAGLLTGWAAMSGEEMVGYATCLISMIPHYGIRIAIGESLFVREVARKSGAGIRLIDAIERHARAHGVQAVFMSCPLGSDYSKVLERRSYSAETTTYVKSLCHS